MGTCAGECRLRRSGRRYGGSVCPLVETETSALLREVETDNYRPLPLLPIVVQKKPHSNATRTLMVPSVRDRVLQTAAGRQLGHAFEDEFLECSFA